MAHALTVAAMSKSKIVLGKKIILHSIKGKVVHTSLQFSLIHSLVIHNMSPVSCIVFGLAVIAVSSDIYTKVTSLARFYFI